jgi:hypothetical protein
MLEDEGRPANTSAKKRKPQMKRNAHPLILLVSFSSVMTCHTPAQTFKTLHDFTAGSDGGNPPATSPYTNSDGANPTGLILSGNTLYGTTQWGGTYGSGTVFSIVMQPQLAVVPSGPNVILTWPTNYAGFDYTRYTLQSTTNLASPIWTTNLPAPVVVNGLNTVTNPVSGVQEFFRMSQ